MPSGLTHKLAILMLLFATIVAHGVVDRAGLLRGAVPAILATAATFLVGVTTYPRQATRSYTWLPPAVAVTALAATAWIAYEVCLGDTDLVERGGFGWLALSGLGLVSASAIKRLVALLDIIDAVSRASKDARRQTA